MINFVLHTLALITGPLGLEKYVDSYTINMIPLTLLYLNHSVDMYKEYIQIVNNTYPIFETFLSPNQLAVSSEIKENINKNKICTYFYIGTILTYRPQN